MKKSKEQQLKYLRDMIIAMRNDYANNAFNPSKDSYSGYFETYHVGASKKVLFMPYIISPTFSSNDLEKLRKDLQTYHRDMHLKLVEKQKANKKAKQDEQQKQEPIVLHVGKDTPPEFKFNLTTEKVKKHTFSIELAKVLLYAFLLVAVTAILVYMWVKYGFSAISQHIFVWLLMANLTVDNLSLYNYAKRIN